MFTIEEIAVKFEGQQHSIDGVYDINRTIYNCYCHVECDCHVECNSYDEGQNGNIMYQDTSYIFPTL